MVVPDPIAPTDARRHGRQGGFTMIELMVAMSIGLTLLLSLYGIVLQTTSMATVMQGQVTTNKNAREIFQMLEDGGIYGPAAAPSPVPGMRGQPMIANQDEATLLTNPIATQKSVRSVLMLSDPANGTNSISSSVMPGAGTGISVPCTAVSTPHYACQGTDPVVVAGTIADLAGLISAHPTFLTTNIMPNGTSPALVVLPVKLLNSSLVGQADAVTQGANSDLVDRQTMVFRVQEVGQ